ncbi:MAG: CpaF family protein, partial [Actinobacteria bacterium]|nr:CpaF family protein [Actinomycetota bacterium]
MITDIVKDSVHERLLDRLGPQLYDGELDSSRANLVQEVVDEVLGVGPIQPLLRNARVSEIMVNRFDTIYFEEDGKLFKSDLVFSNEEHLRRTIERIVSNVGRRIDESSPLVDARLADGSRVNAVVPPISIDGAALTIRKFAHEPFNINDLIDLGTVSSDAAEFLNACIQARLNILISGGTGSGKTTTLNVLSAFIPDDERIITVEDAA